jgi:1,4-alpha-glucan branching enzyme
VKKVAITFTFYAPNARSVCLAGDFNGWNMSSQPLNKAKTGKGGGIWRRIAYLEPGVYEYRFVVDGAWTNGEGGVEEWTDEFRGFTRVLWV